MFGKVSADHPAFHPQEAENGEIDLRELPDKVYTNVVATFSTNQAALYESVTEKIMRQIAESRMDAAERPGGVMKSKGLILKLLGSLKVICDHPALYMGSGN